MIAYLIRYIRAAEWTSAINEDAAMAAAAESAAAAMDGVAPIVVGTDACDGAVLRRLWTYQNRADAYKAYGRIVGSKAYRPEWVAPRLRLEDLELRALLTVAGEPADLAKAARFLAAKAEPPPAKGKASAPTLLEQMDGR